MTIQELQKELNGVFDKYFAGIMEQSDIIVRPGDVVYYQEFGTVYKTTVTESTLAYVTKWFNHKYYKSYDKAVEEAKRSNEIFAELDNRLKARLDLERNSEVC